MPKTKNAKTASVSTAKTEATSIELKKAVAETPAEKNAKKPVATKTASKKTTEAKPETKAPVKSTKKVTVPKETVKIQFVADEYDLAEIKKSVELDYKNKFTGKIKTVEIYIKPEDKAAYYVINSDFSDKVNL